MREFPLVLHPKWQEAVSKQDMDLFERVMGAATQVEDHKIQFLSAKVARNYRNDLLATVLVVNGTNETFSVSEMGLDYFEGNKTVATNIFTIPSLTVEPNTVTPWTFIFPAITVLCDPQFLEWKIKLKKTASA